MRNFRGHLQRGFMNGDFTPNPGILWLQSIWVFFCYLQALFWWIVGYWNCKTRDSKKFIFILPMVHHWGFYSTFDWIESDYVFWISNIPIGGLPLKQLYWLDVSNHFRDFDLIMILAFRSRTILCPSIWKTQKETRKNILPTICIAIYFAQRKILWGVCKDEGKEYFAVHKKKTITHNE